MSKKLEEQAREWIRTRNNGRYSLLPELTALLTQVQAEAWLEERKKAVRWLLYIGGNDHETCLDILKGTPLRPTMTLM